jgi:transaldolase
MNRINALHELGQSVWLDFISRELITSGDLESLIKKDEVRGVTSNPTIFEQAISKTDQYKEAIHLSSTHGCTAAEILDDLILDDIRASTDLFSTQYHRTNGRDGFVSVEVNPDLANDTEKTLKEVRRVWAAVNRPNVMIKIPATKEGISAIQSAIAEGINVNITLIFSLDRYEEVMEAYLTGLEKRHESGEPIDHVASVASFFVSRIDTAVDKALDEIVEAGDHKDLSSLYGKAAIASAKIAYEKFQSVFGSSRFMNLSKNGARVQRPLWASTSTKNPAYPDTYYVDHLIGTDTVNTLPPKTLEAYRDHGRVDVTIHENLEQAKEVLAKLEDLGISLKEVTDQLEKEGVEKFATSFHNLLKTVALQVPSSHPTS